MSSATLRASDVPYITVRHNGGAISQQKLREGAVAVTRNKAVVVDERGREIRPKKVVVCKCAVPRPFHPELRAGAIVSAIDPGEHHEYAILPWATERNPVILKSHCRPHLECEPPAHTGEGHHPCKGCANHHKKGRRK